jgi:hypothetical protein
VQVKVSSRNSYDSPSSKIWKFIMYVSRGYKKRSGRYIKD